jgi:amino acid transporter
MSLIAWVVAGFIALMGGCTYAELGAAIPESGGEYVYLFHCYGHLTGFLFSWTSNWVLKPGGLAIASIVCAQYLTKPFFLHSDPPSKWIDICR